MHIIHAMLIELGLPHHPKDFYRFLKRDNYSELGKGDGVLHGHCKDR